MPKTSKAKFKAYETELKISKEETLVSDELQGARLREFTPEDPSLIILPNIYLDYPVKPGNDNGENSREITKKQINISF